MDKKLKVTIYTPFGLYLQTEADYLSTTSAVGVIGILPNHAPLVSTLEISKLVIKNNSEENIYAIGGGVIHIKKDRSVVLLLNSIESKDDIDVDRAYASKKRAEERLQSNSSEVEINRAKLSLLRANNRIDVGGRK